MKFMNNKKNKYLFFTILFIFIGYLIYGIISFNNNIWYDEAYQMILNRYNFKKIKYFIMNDTNGPLYAYLLKIVTSIFGNKLYVGRLLSLTIYNIQFIIAFYPMRKLFNFKTSLIYSIMSLLSFYSIFCSTEIRLYSLSMVSVLGATIYGLLYFKEKDGNDKKNLIFYTIFSVAATYAHNYATIAIFFLQIMIFILSIINKKKRIIIANLLVFIFYLPWLRILFKQEKDINGNFWITKPTFKTLSESIHKLFNQNNIICIFLLIIFIICLIFMFKRKKYNKNSFLVIIPAIITLSFFVIYSFLKNPLFTTKYITPVCGLIYVSISSILSNSKFKYLPLIYLVLLIPNFINIYSYELKKSNDITTNKMINFINTNVKGDKVFFNTMEYDLGMSEYYFPNSKHYLEYEMNMVVRKPEIYGSVINNYKIINDKYLIVLTYYYLDSKNFIYRIPGKYNIINEYHQKCLYNDGYTVYILKKSK